jgi:hypothetical protein
VLSAIPNLQFHGHSRTPIPATRRIQCGGVQVRLPASRGAVAVPRPFPGIADIQCPSSWRLVGRRVWFVTTVARGHRARHAPRPSRTRLSAERLLPAVRPARVSGFTRLDRRGRGRSHGRRFACVLSGLPRSWRTLYHLGSSPGLPVSRRGCAGSCPACGARDSGVRSLEIASAVMSGLNPNEFTSASRVRGRRF